MMVERAGAARRMPSGALMSALAGAGYNAARGAAEVEPQLKMTQARVNQPLEMMKARLKVANTQQDNQFFQSGLGNIFKTVLLWKAGLLGDAGGLGNIGINPAATGEQQAEGVQGGGTSFGIGYQPQIFQGLPYVPYVSRDSQNMVSGIGQAIQAALGGF